MATFLFDLYGVILKDAGLEHRDQIERALGMFESDPRLWELYESMRGDLDADRVSEYNFWSQLLMRLRPPNPDIDIEEIIVAHHEGVTDADPEMVDYVLDLKQQGHTVGVLSNVPEGVVNRIRQQHAQWLDQLDAVTFSCEAKAAKPEPAAFRAALNSLGADAAETTFIDDRPDFVEAARAEGLNGVVFEGVDKLKETLNNA